MTPALSVVIPAFSPNKTLLPLICRLENQVFPEGFEVIVVDDASPEPLISRIAPLRLSHVRVLQLRRNLGPAGARNFGVDQARGQALVFLDSDCILSSDDHLARMYECFRKNPDAIWGGTVLGVGIGYAALSDRFCETTNLPTRRNVTVSSGHLLTAHLLVPRSVWSHIGPFDERLRSGEDVAFFYRAHEAKIPVLFENGLVVHHQDRETFSAFLGNQYFTGLYRSQSRRIGTGEVPWFLGGTKLRRAFLVFPIAIALTLKHFLAWFRFDPRVLIALPGLFAGMLALSLGVMVGTRPRV